MHLIKLILTQYFCFTFFIGFSCGNQKKAKLLLPLNEKEKEKEKRKPIKVLIENDGGEIEGALTIPDGVKKLVREGSALIFTTTEDGSYKLTRVIHEEKKSQESVVNNNSNEEEKDMRSKNEENEEEEDNSDPNSNNNNDNSSNEQLEAYKEEINSLKQEKEILQNKNELLNVQKQLASYTWYHSSNDNYKKLKQREEELQKATPDDKQQ